jgi:hypothetical protein
MSKQSKQTRGAPAVSRQPAFGSFDRFGGEAAALCVTCGRHPRLGALTRCQLCLKAAADVDRQSRVDAEARVGARKREAESARLDVQADAILARDNQLMQELGQHVQALESCYRELLEPRNDPEYFRNLERRSQEVSEQANVTERVEHRIISGRTEIVILPTNPRNTAQGREAAVRVGRLFEAPVRYVEDPHDATKFADRPQKSPPKHTFGRERRSLGNGGKDR